MCNLSLLPEIRLAEKFMRVVGTESSISENARRPPPSELGDGLLVSRGGYWVGVVVVVVVVVVGVGVVVVVGAALEVVSLPVVSRGL